MVDTEKNTDENSPSGAATQGQQLHPVLKKRFGYCLYKAAMQMKARLDKELSELGLVSQQLGILTVLCEEGPSAQAELSRGMGIDQASMVRFVDGLEASGYLTREADANDRRLRLLSITPKGRRIHTEARERVSPFEARALKGYSAADIQKMQKMLVQIFEGY